MAEKKTASVIDFAERHRATDRKRFTPMFGPQEKTVTFVAPQVDDENGELPWDFDEILVLDTQGITSRVEVDA